MGLAKVASLALVAVLVTGCAGSGVVSDRSGNGPTRVSGPRTAAMSSSDGDLNLDRPRIDVTNWDDQSTLIPLHLFVPEAARNIGPGSAIVITIPNEGRFGCTANFVWEARGRKFLGSAGHCFLPAAATATHGPGADYDASGVLVDVCVENCEGNFRSNLLLGKWVRLGKVAYARQQNLEGRGVGHDFGVVEIPREFSDFVRAEMPVWRGPTGVQEMHLGDYGCHYGHGLLVGETFVTKARVGVGGGANPDSWHGDFVAAFGDSGSPMVGCVNDGLGFHGTGAVGVITHLGVRVSTTGQHGVILGTTIRRAVEMAREANLRLNLVLP